MDRRDDKATWIAERVATLKRLLSDPRRLTAQQIASELGVSRNAVVGKAARLGLRLPNHSLRNPWRPSGLEEAPLHGRVPDLEAPTDCPSGSPTARGQRTARPKHIAFLDLEPHHCRWPYGRRLPFTFCGCDRIARSAYCAVHTGESREQAEQTNASPERGKQTAIASPVAYHGDEYACRSQRAA
jgi:GcrA cell cycle regulator